VKLMNPALVEVTESGVNVEVAIDALLESKPYLREPMSRGSADQGARGSQASRGISRGDLEHMTHEQIIAAQDAGLLQHLGIGGQ
jgi:hypothetical protein